MTKNKHLCGYVLLNGGFQLQIQLYPPKAQSRFDSNSVRYTFAS